MGLGGYLTWTAAARELHSRTGLKCFPFEQHGNFIKLIKSPIFHNNPHFEQDFSEKNCVPLQLNNPATNYCLNDLHDRAIHKKDNHIIHTICNFYGIDNPQLKCEIFLDESEKKEVNKILDGLPEEFITIEPFSNTDYTINRGYPFKKWQKIVDDLANDFNIVQIGMSPLLLKGVLDLRGKTTFRTAGGIIEKSKLLLSSEGGLTHLSTAFDTPAFVILTGYQTLKMVKYPQNLYLDISNHGPCGYKRLCKDCQEDAINHDVKEAILKLSEFLKDK